jgi:hypothetical protein
MNDKARQSIQKALDLLKEGRLWAWSERLEECVYEDEQGRCCVVGAMLSRPTLDLMHRDDLIKGASVVMLARSLPGGPQDIEQETGLTVEQLGALQLFHDDVMCLRGEKRKQVTEQEFQEILEGLLSGEIRELAPRPRHSALCPKATTSSRVQF